MEDAITSVGSDYVFAYLVLGLAKELGMWVIFFAMCWGARAVWRRSKEEKGWPGL